jgi:hypothetical protein
MHLVDGSRGLPDVPEELPEAEIARFRRKWRDVAYADLSPA